jgi:hypothetical protein
MDVDRYPSKWLVAAIGLGISALAYTSFVAASQVGGWLAPLAGPVCLWWVVQGLALLINVSLSRPGHWPGDRRARYIAGGAAIVVGIWIGSGRVFPLAMAVLPLYCVGERWTFSRVSPPDATAVYAPLSVWMMYVLLGELLGFAIGFWSPGFAR